MVKIALNFHRFPARLYRASVDSELFERMYVTKSVGGFESGPVSFDVLDVPESGKKTITVEKVLELAQTVDETHEPVNYFYASALELSSGHGKGVGLPYLLHNHILVVTGTNFQDFKGKDHIAFFTYGRHEPCWDLLFKRTNDWWYASDGPIKILFRHLPQLK